MTSDQREIRRKLRILKHAEASGDVSKTDSWPRDCRLTMSGE